MGMISKKQTRNYPLLLLKNTSKPSISAKLNARDVIQPGTIAGFL
jgi:hypothetical protein